MESVPRHLFVPRELREIAYHDTPLTIGVGATISAPHMVAMQLLWTDLGRGQRILEVGSGSGYLVALTAWLTGPSGLVVGVEMEPSLVEGATRALAEVGLGGRTEIILGDGTLGFPGKAPYDRILVSYAISPPLPEAWSEQLVENGLVVAPVDRGKGTYLERARKRPQGWEVERGAPCRFVDQKPRSIPL